MTLTLLYGRFTCMIPREAPMLQEDIARMFNLRKEGIHLKYHENIGWKNIYPNDGEFCIPEKVEKCYVIGFPAPKEQPKNENLCLVPPSPSISSLQNINVDADNGAHAPANFLRRGNKAVPPLKRSRTER